MVKADDFCSFYAAPTVRLRDWRLGAANYAIKGCIIVYIIYGIFAGDALEPAVSEVTASLRPCVLNETTSPVLCKSVCEDLGSPEQCALLQFPSTTHCTNQSQDAFLLSRDQLASCASLVNEDGFVGMSRDYVAAKAAGLNCSRLAFGQTLRGVFSGDVLTDFDALTSNAQSNFTLVLGPDRSIENPTRYEVLGHLSNGVGLLASAVPGSVLTTLAAKMKGSSALLVVQSPSRTCFRSQVRHVQRHGDSRRLTLTTGTHHYVETQGNVARPIDREDLVTGPKLSLLGSSFVQDIALNDIYVLFSLLNVRAENIGARISTCPVHSGTCTDVRPINMDSKVGPGGVAINRLTVRLADLMLRAGTDLLACSENSECRINIDMHLSNNVLAALWRKGLFFAGDYGDVRADLRIHNTTVPDQVTQAHEWLSANVTHVKFHHGIDVMLTVTSELAVFSWSGLMVYLGAAVGMLAVSGVVVNALATSPLFVGHRSGLYQTYVEMDSADMSYVENELSKTRSLSKEEMVQDLADKRRLQMLEVGGYILSPRGGRGAADQAAHGAADHSARKVVAETKSHWGQETQAMLGSH